LALKSGSVWALFNAVVSIRSNPNLATQLILCQIMDSVSTST
jgi:hypothetical protein